MVLEKIGHVRPVHHACWDLARNASAGEQTDLVLLDFSKAFYKVNHSKLIWKLRQPSTVLHQGKALWISNKEEVALSCEKRLWNWLGCVSTHLDETTRFFLPLTFWNKIKTYVTHQ